MIQYPCRAIEADSINTRAWWSSFAAKAKLPKSKPYLEGWIEYMDGSRIFSLCPRTGSPEWEALRSCPWNRQTVGYEAPLE